MICLLPLVFTNALCSASCNEKMAVDYLNLNSKYSLESRSFSIDKNPYKYSSCYSDLESGLYYLKARYYSSELMRFISRDTYDLSNRYAYCDGNPIEKIDPKGNIPAWQKWCTNISAAIGVGALAGALIPAGLISSFVGQGISGGISQGASESIITYSEGGGFDLSEAAKNFGIGFGIGAPIAIPTLLLRALNFGAFKKMGIKFGERDQSANIVSCYRRGPHIGVETIELPKKIPGRLPTIEITYFDREFRYSNFAVDSYNSSARILYSVKDNYQAVSPLFGVGQSARYKGITFIKKYTIPCLKRTANEVILEAREDQRINEILCCAPFSTGKSTKLAIDNLLIFTLDKYYLFSSKMNCHGFALRLFNYCTTN